MKLQFTIREKLMIFYILLGILAVSSLGLYSFNSVRNAILARSFQQLTSVREVKKARIENFFKDRERDVLFISHVLTDTWGTYSSLRVGGKSVYSRIDLLMQEQQYYSDMFIIPTSKSLPALHYYVENNVVQQSQLSIDSIEFPKHFLSELFCIDTVSFFDYMLCNNHYMLGLAAPVSYFSDSIDAVIVAGISLQAINSIMLETNSYGGLGKSGESYLVGADNVMRSSSRFFDNAIMNQRVETKAVQSAFQHKIGTQIITDYRGVEVLSSYSTVSVFKTEWAILSEIDAQEVLIPVFDIRNDIILMSAIIIFVLCIIAFIFARKITSPLLALQSLAIDIAKGKYGKTIAIESQDEVGDLTEAFNHMSLKIYDKTKDLREREKRLQHFYAATSDGIILHDSENILLVSQAVCNMTEYTEHELLDMPIVDILLIPNPVRYMGHPDKTFVFETDCVKKDGTSFPVEVIDNPVEYEGTIVWASVIRNITERKESEKRLQTERTKRISSFIDGQDDERKRLSQELHDGIGQSLVGIKMRLDTIHLTENSENEHILEMVRTFVQQTISEVRRVSNNLLPSVLQDIGLKRAMEKLCSEISQDSGMNISLDTEMYTKIANDKIKTTIYRIVQEAIHNAIKHSHATDMNIMLIQEVSRVRLIIEDNGVGFDTENIPHRGNGLYSMQERVSILGGTITISSEIQGGTYIDVKIPLKKRS
ncbi:MAG: histidine kinase [Bacteroidales bacterium]|jgi:PAS domain S-box-containing protein|nr:histidine kinase [Bacteroidales bacterium]